MFEHVDAYPGDPILSLMDEFNKDSRENKINLSIGLYYDGDGKPLNWRQSVRQKRR